MCLDGDIIASALTPEVLEKVSCCESGEFGGIIDSASVGLNSRS